MLPFVCLFFLSLCRLNINIIIVYSFSFQWVFFILNEPNFDGVRVCFPCLFLFIFFCFVVLNTPIVNSFYCVYVLCKYFLHADPIGNQCSAIFFLKNMLMFYCSWLFFAWYAVH